MTRLVPALRLMLVTGMALGLGGIAGCGGNGGAVANTAAGSGSGSAAAAGQPAVSKSSSVALSWEAPTENADGSVLQDLQGYRVHYGESSKNYSQTIEVSNPGLTAYVVDNLPAGHYYFAVTAYNSKGTESSLSGEVSTMVD